METGAADGKSSSAWAINLGFVGDAIAAAGVASRTLTVTQKERDGNDFTSEGTVKGAEIRWTTKRQTTMGELVIAYQGTMEGKAMSGTSERVGNEGGPGGPRTWKAERIEP